VKKSLEMRGETPRAGRSRGDFSGPSARREHTYKILTSSSVRPHYPNCSTPTAVPDDGNFGGTAGIAEMLCKTTCEIELLPPAESLAEGSVKGLRARGNLPVTSPGKTARSPVMLASLDPREVKVR